MDYRLGPPRPARNFPMCLQTGLYSNASHKGSTEGGTAAATKSGSCQGLSFVQKDSATPQIPQGKHLPMTSTHTTGQPTPGMGASSQPSLPASYDQLLTEFCLPVIMTICAFRLVPLNKTPVAVEQSWGESFRGQKFKEKSRALCR